MCYLSFDAWQIDFDSIQASLDVERRQKEETERKVEDSRREKLEKVNKEYSGLFGYPYLCVLNDIICIASVSNVVYYLLGMFFIMVLCVWYSTLLSFDKKMHITCKRKYFTRELLLDTFLTIQRSLNVVSA